MSDNDDVEVYTFHGNQGETVPASVEKLIVNPGVQDLSIALCFKNKRLRQVSLPKGLTGIGSHVFGYCQNLLEIKICSTVLFIGTKRSLCVQA